MAQFIVIQYSRDSTSDSLGRAEGHKQTSLTVSHDRTRAHNISGDDRHSRRHRLHDRTRHTLAARGQREDIARREHIGNVIALTCEVHTGLHPEPVGLRFEASPVRTGAEAHELDRRTLGGKQSKGGQQVRYALALSHARYANHELCLVADPELRTRLSGVSRRLFIALDADPVADKDRSLARHDPLAHREVHVFGILEEDVASGPCGTPLGNAVKQLYGAPLRCVYGAVAPGVHRRNAERSSEVPADDTVMRIVRVHQSKALAPERSQKIPASQHRLLGRGPMRQADVPDREAVLMDPACPMILWASDVE